MRHREKRVTICHPSPVERLPMNPNCIDCGAPTWPLRERCHRCALAWRIQLRTRVTLATRQGAYTGARCQCWRCQGAVR
jgi:hypothetical protein